MTQLDQAVAMIDRHLDAARDEMSRLEQARSHLTGGTGPARPSRHAQALQLIHARPGITAAELSRELPGKTYGYTLVKRLRTAGDIEPCDRGWRVAS